MIIFSLLIITSTFLYVYRVSTTLSYDFKTLYDGHTLDYNLKLLTLQLSTDNRIYEKSYGGVVFGLFLMFILNIGVACSTESILEVQAGVVFLAFFMSLLSSLILSSPSKCIPFFQRKQL